MFNVKSERLILDFVGKHVGKTAHRFRDGKDCVEVESDLVLDMLVALRNPRFPCFFLFGVIEIGRRAAERGDGCDALSDIPVGDAGIALVGKSEANRIEAVGQVQEPVDGGLPHGYRGQGTVIRLRSVRRRREQQE